MSSSVLNDRSNIDHMLFECERILSNCMSQQYESLSAAWAHHFSAKGKRSRMRLALSTSSNLGLTSQQSECLAIACELVHQASLIHDDLMDADASRNGKATVWRKYGQATAVCLGDALLVEAMFQLSCTPDISAVTRQALIRLVRDSVQAAAEGQIDDCDISKLHNFSYSDYCTAVQNKSGALFAMPAIGAMLVKHSDNSEIERAIAGFSEFGIAYQLLDDWKDREVDKDRRLNGYWLLDRTNPDAAEVSLRTAVIKHLDTADKILSTLPHAIYQSFSEIRDEMLLKLPELKTDLEVVN
ncbi:polyprenyl synthetase family protein [Aliidiomarina iranensis]|nr:polyprenyl synthetase family protein [Aliidiomarina iranensis]